MASRGMRIRSGGHGGFTLIEVLVVVAIIALLIAILMPSLKAARESARVGVCTSNLHQISVAMTTYENEYNGYVPRAGEKGDTGIWLKVITRQVGDKRKYDFVLQVPVERFPVFQCPTRTATLPNPFIDYVINGFIPESDQLGYGIEKVATPLSVWKNPADVILVGDAPFECRVEMPSGAPCSHDPIGADEKTMRKNRLNHPAAAKLTSLAAYDENIHGSLDRMDIFDRTQVQTRSGRRAGTVTHGRSFADWNYLDGHAAPVKWLNNKRTENDWLRMFGVKIKAP